MAGLSNRNSAIYLTISNGKICRQLQNKSEKSVERTNKNGKLVHEEFYDHLSGMLTNISVREADVAGTKMKFWQLTVDADGVIYQLQFNYSSSYAASFLKALPNADLTKQITLAPFMKVEGDKKKTTLFITQNGKALKHAYTKDAPNGLPELKKVRVKGADVWDDTDMMDFLEKMVKETVLPQLKSSSTNQPTEPALAGAGTVEDDGEMPF